MPDDSSDTTARLQPIVAPSSIRVLWLAALVGAAALVTVPILPGVMWALLIGYWTFPLHRRIAARLPPMAAAAVSTILVVSVAIPPVLWLLDTSQQIWFWAETSLPATIENVLTRLRELAAGTPYIGLALLRALPRYAQEIDWVSLGSGTANAVGGLLASAILRAGNWAFHVAIGIGTLFFVYLDGRHWWQMVGAALDSAFGTRTGSEACRMCVRTASAVTRGVILTALLQGVLAGLGYWTAGVPQPLLLAVLTVPAAVVPLGASLVWVPAAAWLALSGSPGAGFALALWGVLVVSTADNALRPLLMYERTPLPFWPLTLSIIGGTLALGLPGVYIGPITYALAHMALSRVTKPD